MFLRSPGLSTWHAHTRGFSLLLPSRLHWASRKAPRHVISELLLVLGVVAFVFSFASPDDDSTQLEVAETASVQTAFAPAASGPSLIVLTGPTLTSRSPFPVPVCNSTRVTSMEDFGSCRTSVPRPFGLRSPPPHRFLIAFRLPRVKGFSHPAWAGKL